VGNRSVATRSAASDCLAPRRAYFSPQARGPRRFSAYLRRCSTALENTELVALGIGQHHPRNVVLSNVNTRRSERGESLDLGGLIVRTKIYMQPVLALLGFVDGQEQDPWKTIWLWLNLKHRWVVVDDYPPERFAPPPTQRGRVMCGDNDLFPFKAHGVTIAQPFLGWLTSTPSKSNANVLGPAPDKAGYGYWV